MEFLLQSYRNGVKTIKFNRPEKKNAICMSMYKTLTEILNKDASNDDIVVTIITGVGDYFSSGNDIKSAMQSDSEENLKSVKDMVDAFINYPKLLISVVNGTAIGIGATIAALCDIVYATENAVFDTPFVRMGLCVEGCSSYTFPHILGRSKASEVMYLNYQLSAREAYQFGLVSKVIPNSELEQFINDLHKHGSLPVNSLKRNKAVVMENWKKQLTECNAREFVMLRKCIDSDDFTEAIMKFMSRKSKL